MDNEKYKCCQENGVVLQDTSLLEDMVGMGEESGKTYVGCPKNLRDNPCMYYRRMFDHNLCLVRKR